MRNSIVIFALVATVAFHATAIAQTDVLPAAPQSQPVLLTGGMVHVGNGQVIQNGAVGFADGTITLVDAVSNVTDQSGYQVIDVSGMHVYPGLILPNVGLGLYEVGQVPATLDLSETGTYNPSVRALSSYNTDSELIPTLRFNGILLAQSAPTGGVISGTSSIMKLDGWNWEDAVYHADDAIHFNWPAQMLPPRWWMGETEYRKNDRYESTVDNLNRMFHEAASYGSTVDPADRNIKFDALQGLFDGSKALHVRTNDARSIIEAVSFANTHGVSRVVVVGGHEAALVSDLLVENDIPVVLANVHRVPPNDHEDTVYPYKLPKELTDAGLTVALGYSGLMSSRNLPFFVGTAVAHGMDAEEALKMVTSNSAKVLGISDRTGTLETGKDANIVVSRGDLMDMRGNRLVHAFIEGAAIQLDARQQTLYKKYSDKYGHEIQ